MWEEACWEGERGAEHMIELGTHDKAAGMSGIHVHDKALRDLWIQKAIKEGARQGNQAKESLCILAPISVRPTRSRRTNERYCGGPSDGAPLPDEPANNFVPSGSVTSAALPRVLPSLNDSP